MRGRKSNFKTLYSSQDKSINDIFLICQLLVAFDGLALERLLWIFLLLTDSHFIPFFQAQKEVDQRRLKVVMKTRHL